MNQAPLLPRLIRLRDAPHYLGMQRHSFNALVRPYVVEIPIGQTGIAFDRLDLEAWVDHYKKCSDRSATSNTHRRLDVWDEKERRASTNVVGSGTLTKRFSDADFAKALALATSKKPNDS